MHDSICRRPQAWPPAGGATRPSAAGLPKGNCTGLEWPHEAEGHTPKRKVSGLGRARAPSSISRLGLGAARRQLSGVHRGSGDLTRTQIGAEQTEYHLSPRPEQLVCQVRLIEFGAAHGRSLSSASYRESCPQRHPNLCCDRRLGTASWTPHALVSASPRKGLKRWTLPRVCGAHAYCRLASPLQSRSGSVIARPHVSGTPGLIHSSVSCA